MPASSSRRPWWDKPPALWLPVLAWAAAIFFVSAQHTLPPVGEGWFDRVVKQLAHSAEYAVLAWLVWRPLTRSGRERSPRSYLVVWAVCLAYALSDEFHQWFVPGRSADWRDVLADGLGAALTLAVLRQLPDTIRAWMMRRSGRPPS